MLRRLEPRDFDCCAEIALLNWGSDTAARVRDELEATCQDAHSVGFVSTAGNRLTGFASLERTRVMRDTWSLTWCNVHPAYQRQRIGSLLTQHRLEHIAMQGGRLVLAVTREIGFYERFGFLQCRGFGAWVLMSLELGPLEL